jgi:hypothetical protein
MRRVVGWSVVVMALLTGAASAQPVAGFMLAQVTTPAPMQEQTQAPASKPLFTIFGLPVRIGSPVTPLYCPQCQYQNFGGQPARAQNYMVSGGGGRGG